jgi:proteic killer suppression protein
VYTISVYKGAPAVIRRVLLTRTAGKQLRKVPRHVATKLLEWIDLVEEKGLDEARRIPGYHDESLRGDREGQRSIRLSRSYRAVYVIVGWEGAHGVRVEEGSKHEY